MAQLIPIAGGKGGVGKSVVSLNVSIALASQCKRVVLCDFDFGGANLHTMLGLKNNQAGLGNFIYKQETKLENLLQATGIPNLYFIAGDCLFPGTANMDFFTKKKLMKEISQLNADYVILDLGAGSSYNVLDFYLMTYNGILVISPELTSVLNAYSFIKSALYRFYYRQFPAKSQERLLLQNSMLQRIEGKQGDEYSFMHILNLICEQFPASGAKALAELEKFKPRVIMNMGRRTQDAEMGIRLRNLAKNKLSITLEYIGFIPYDEIVGFTIASRSPMVIQYPQSAFSSVIPAIAQRILRAKHMDGTSLEDVPEDFEKMVENFYENMHIENKKLKKN